MGPWVVPIRLNLASRTNGPGLSGAGRRTGVVASQVRVTDSGDCKANV